MDFVALVVSKTSGLMSFRETNKVSSTLLKTCYYRQGSVEPVMTAYKLVTVQFKWWGLQTKVENFIHTTERRLFTNFHRQVIFIPYVEK